MVFSDLFRFGNPTGCSQCPASGGACFIRRLIAPRTGKLMTSGGHQPSCGCHVGAMWVPGGCQVGGKVGSRSVGTAGGLVLSRSTEARFEGS